MSEHFNILRARWLELARVFWLAVAALSVGLLIAGAPEYYDQLRTLSDPDLGNPAMVRADLAEAGLSAGLYAAYLLALDVVFSVVSFAVGTLIFWRKSAEPMALLVALMLVTIGVDNPTVEALTTSYPIADWVYKGLSFVGGMCLLLFFYLFPNGRFVPRWTRWLLIVGVGLVVAQTFFPKSPLDGDLPAFGLLLTGMFAQIYRYVRVSGPVERLQTKWVVFGVAVGITGFLATIMLPSFLPGSYPQNDTLGDLVGNTIIGLFLGLIPISIGVAVLRSRLFDIDIIINRTLVYGALSVMLTVIYFGGVAVLQRLLSPLTGESNQLATVASTLLIAALFNPLRRRNQQFIDRRFYRRKYDAAKTLETFSVKLRDETNLEQLNADLLSVVRETMQPEHVSLWLRPGTERKKAETG